MTAYWSIADEVKTTIRTVRLRMRGERKLLWRARFALWFGSAREQNLALDALIKFYEDQ